MTSEPGLDMLTADPRLLPVGFKLARFAFSQNARSFSGGCMGGSILHLLETESFVMVAREGSLTKVPICGPRPVLGVEGRDVAGVLAGRETVRVGGGVTGVPLNFAAAALRSCSFALCSSSLSSSVSSPLPSALQFRSVKGLVNN